MLYSSQQTKHWQNNAHSKQIEMGIQTDAGQIGNGVQIDPGNGHGGRAGHQIPTHQRPASTKPRPEIDDRKDSGEMERRRSRGRGMSGGYGVTYQEEKGG